MRLAVLATNSKKTCIHTKLFNTLVFFLFRGGEVAGI